ncbi:DUF4399 domain-containing protein [Shimia sp.]|jgi:hypothetical protein|uniref:DUF4399 domain-containing protein n=1 Tax=unclassified Shimia TaxID=2630038 RepID=UPI0025DAAAD3|nr:DUF4399 domain-containing protein [Shimia sp.]MCH2067614.1 DUF4399 domain-containing protein [Shimia sp.]
MKKLVAALAIMLSSQVFAGETPSPDGAKVYFINLSDGDSVEAPFVVNFGLSGMGVAPAGTEKENTGHHHIFINRPPLGEGAEDAELMENGVPTDDNHRHFGGGQTEVTLDLPAGTHTLQLVLGDEFHVPHNPPVVSEVITITVK